MTDRDKSVQLAERQDDATDARTLDEIEDQEEVTAGSDSLALSPDQGSGFSPGDDPGSGAPM